MELDKKVLSDITIFGKYAKYNNQLQRRETWNEICDRYEDMMITKYPILESEIKTNMFYVRDKKVLPSMRALQFAGRPVELNNSRIFNCAFLPVDHYKSFSETMFLLLGGTGVGYSVQFSHIDKLPEIQKPTKTKRYLIADSIEGWADAVKILMKSYFGLSNAKPLFDYRDIRPKGARLITAGGKAPGFEPLKACLDKIELLLETKNNGEKLSSVECHDIQCHIANAVLAGGIRRAALISLFSFDDDDMLQSKSNFKILDWKHTQIEYREPNTEQLQFIDSVHIDDKTGEKYYDLDVTIDEPYYGIKTTNAWWVREEDLNKLKKEGTLPWYYFQEQRGRANNSAVAIRSRIKKKEFIKLWKKIELSGAGEPGISWSNNNDWGFNPCHEISLRSYQFCNLCEVNVSELYSQDDLNKRVEIAAFFGTLQAGFTDFHYLRDVWKKTTEKDALIGVGMTGIGSGDVLKYDISVAAQVCKDVNEKIASIININKAARCTTVKPAGCQVKETMLITNEGILSLEEIGDTKGQKWQDIKFKVSQEKNMYDSTKFYINGLAKTKKILLNSGIELESTFNHKYRILDEYGNYIWKRADELNINDIIPYKIGGYDGGTEQSLIQITEKTNHSFEIFEPKILNENLAWLLGLYFGDGSNHKKGIRIAGDKQKDDILIRAKNIIKEQFNINCLLYTPKNNIDNKMDLYANSIQLLEFLKINSLLKQKSKDIEIPLIIRKSPKNIIKSFIDGYAHADGSFKTNGLSFCTISKKWASQLVIILRAIGDDAKIRLMPPTDTSKGNNMRYWVSVRQGRKVNERYIEKIKKENWKKLSDAGLDDFSYDTILEIVDSENETYDIEVPENNCYLANSYVSHNTTSLVLGTSSGIHAWHNDFYIRRMRLGKNEALYTYLSIYNPDLLEDDFFSPQTQAIVKIPVRAPKDSILRNENVIDLLERVKVFNENWVREGHRIGDNFNNVSATISIKTNEWDKVGEWMWNNRDVYSGISVLPYDNGTYIQAPFTDCTEEEYNDLLSKLHDIDVTNIIEMDDITDLKGELACASGGCEVK